MDEADIVRCNRRPLLSLLISHTRLTSRRTLGLLLALLVIGIAALAWLYRDALTLDALEDLTRDLGVWAPVGFAAIYAIATVAMVPGSFFDALGGAVFGPVLGSIVNFIGGSLGAMLAFALARYFAGDWVERRAAGRLGEIKQSVEAEGWRFVAFIRLVPIFPYTVFNYLLGLTRIPFWQYTVVTMICMAPSTVVYTWLGHAARHLAFGQGGEHPLQYGLIFLAVAATAVFLPRFIMRWRERARSGHL